METIEDPVSHCAPPLLADGPAEVSTEISLINLPSELDDTPGFPVLSLCSAIEQFGCIPTPLQLNAELKKTEWILRPGWQSVSEIYRVLHDLHTRQRYTALNLIYLPIVQLVAILGVEPVNVYDIQPELAQTAEPGPTEISTSYQELMAGKLRPDPPQKVREDSPREAAYVIPGNFSSAVLTGNIRIMLEEELERSTPALMKAGFDYHFSPGWMLAITDCDQVCYYVERMLTLDQLMASSTHSREEELSTFFGRNKAINLRSLATRKANQKQQKERQSRWFESQAELNAAFELRKQQEQQQPPPEEMPIALPEEHMDGNIEWEDCEDGADDLCDAHLEQLESLGN